MTKSATEGRKIRVVVADDHTLVRQGIQALLNRSTDIEVVGAAADGQMAIELVQQLVPDVLLADIAMPRLDGIQAVGLVSAMKQGTRTIILSMFDDEALVRQALEMGASGYLLKDSALEELLVAIRAAVRGGIYLSPAVSPSIVAEFLEGRGGGETPSPSADLTPREREVLQLIAEGHTNASVARLLHVSIKTVEKHRSNLMGKLGVHDVAALLDQARRRRLIFSDDAPPLPPQVY